LRGRCRTTRGLGTVGGRGRARRARYAALAGRCVRLGRRPFPLRHFMTRTRRAYRQIPVKTARIMMRRARHLLATAP
jgi:hypothetical protein